jgi:hypothetical protein
LNFVKAPVEALKKLPNNDIGTQIIMTSKDSKEETGDINKFEGSSKFNVVNKKVEFHKENASESTIRSAASFESKTESPKLKKQNLVRIKTMRKLSKKRKSTAEKPKEPI